MRHDAAFSEFVAARQTHLRRVAYALCGDWHRADDLLQTALTKLYVAWPRIRHEGGEEAYVRQIMVRANIDESRRPWRRERPSAELPERPAAPGTDVEDRSALFDALQALSEQQRKVVVLRHWLGLSVRETAAELGISEGTVKSHSSRGLTALEEVLARQA
ncbi:RNA polymerase sigma-70 factor (sigma-E family) [Nocardioides cavernae]|uniref:RNA polymerase sigma-70 factor (Sigma-E family) n=1 Tax=Nocardioides cavernae TaxID=1921566 RepID=A0A7Y9H136_9ACTN|nr:SigE family RNA polymerase sigma factor [Nocardioides cavernae]NYE35987.1 RNA polymerase sigma-70 factor (sigma-E family) [Nocardioides cavernae]